MKTVQLWGGIHDGTVLTMPETAAVYIAPDGIMYAPTLPGDYATSLFRYQKGMK